MKISIINQQMIRNYMIAMATVGIASIGVGELFYSPSRMAKQQEINQYAPYVSVGVVNYGKDFVTNDREVILP